MNESDVPRTLALKYARFVDDREFGRMREIMARYRPNLVFHAAAHKHVPLMEANPVEAVKNNVFGTWNLVEASKRAGVDRFVMISTDKVVEPTSVYGASKRIAEQIVLATQDGENAYMVVRFGNVLGSSGSIIPREACGVLFRAPPDTGH